MPRPPSADWPTVLATAQAICDAAPELPTTPELWQRLLDCGALAGGGTQWAGLRHQLREAQKRGTFPQLPRAKTGPTPGTPWNADRRAHNPDDAADPAERAKRAEAAYQYLLAVLPTQPGGLLLNPEQLAAFAISGWGSQLIYEAVHRLQAQGRAVAVVRAVVPLVTLVRAA